MQYWNNILAIEASWLIEQGIMTEVNYKNLTNRQDIQVVRRGCRGQGALVAYESMPERFRRKVEAIIPDPYKAVQVNMVEEHIEHSAAASAFFDGYRLGDDRHLPVEKRREYYANAIVLDAVGSLIAQRAAKRRSLGHNATRFWEAIADAVQNLDRTRYPHALPANARSLERKYKQYKAEGYESLVHKAFLAEHANADKMMSEEQKAMFTYIASDPRNLDNAQVAAKYNTCAVALGWKTITASTVARRRDTMDLDISARRRGYANFRDKKAMQVKRKAPSYPLYFWTMDGWKAELLYKKRITDKDGKTTLKYHNSLTMVVVLDACCQYPIGYAIGTNESKALIAEALRNAAKHTEELFGQMYRTAQLQTDHYGRGGLKDVYNTMSDKYTPAQVGNAKSKIIEHWFGVFNKKYCQMQMNWSGFGVTSKKSLQPNPDFLNKHKDQFPDFEELCAQLVSFLEAERRELRDKYVALFNEMPAENRFPLPYDQYLMLYGIDNGQRQLMQGNGLILTVGGEKKQYDCFDPAFREHASTRWQVRFDPDDMHTVLAVNEDESLRFMLEEKYVQPMALIERSEGDAKELQRVLMFNKILEARIAAKMCDYENTVSDLLQREKKAELETLSKFLITDSRGQHKDNLSRARALSGRATTAEIIDDTFSPTDLLDEY